MINFRNRACWLLAVVVTTSAHAVAARYPITIDRVVDATTRAGMQTSADQIELPGGVVANSPAPVLKVQSVRSLAGGSSVVRFECEGGQCLPFYARLKAPKSGNAPRVVAAAATPAASAPPLTTSRRTAVVHSGDQATLWLEGEHVHISVKVVCIDAGGVGEKVRARGSSNRQMYTAQVVDSAVLRAKL